MLVLGIESSGKTASTALWEDGTVLAEYSVNIGLTHSQTLLPMVAEIFSRTGKRAEDLALIAVSAGPGSFTGLRIGAATGKGIALSYDIPMAEVSTLEGLAHNVSECECLVHPIMDARRHQVYTAAFKRGKLIGTEEAVSIEELIDRLNREGGRHLFLGDAVPVYRKYIEEHMTGSYAFASAVNYLQRASSIAELGAERMAAGLSKPGMFFELSYIRKPQAEREREAQGLKQFDMVKDTDTAAQAGVTKDKLQAQNYVIGSGTGYENEVVD
ncbi:tRNA (adenosine(37)-N6)-threonylcarbamoyltransferase complex dimerization subunit type 1 TsaB [Oribacterium sp. HCP28S3_H8]|uniref:tRNA (adenosine(37)-N6)-threonylcarbamoyltransferase complex dimerization subunit type 1 TsaB n=1 Tax=Oribacterium sp. HCP28S3_H8 TaxID=3438945 RepID=UPI003F89BC9C